MAFNFLQNRVTKAINNVKKSSFVTEENISSILNEIKIVLIEADVNIKVVDKFLNDIKQKAIGEIVQQGNTSSQVVLKLINEQLVELLGGEEYE